MEATLQGLAPPPAARLEAGHSRRSGGSRSAVDSLTLSSEAVLRITSEALEAEFGAKIAAKFDAAGIDLSQGAGLDWSPEATAQRIFDFSAGMFEIWKSQNEDMSEKDQIDTFEETIRGAIGEGYGSAIDTLKAMEVGEEVLSVSEKTMSALASMLDDFFGKLRGGDGPGAVLEVDPVAD
ncbi:MAG: DUF5610 domain-containing protein [Nannocystaceae bacterium]